MPTTTNGPSDWVREAIETARDGLLPSRKTRIAEMIDIVTDAIEVLRTRDGVPVTHDMARERARNILAVFIAGDMVVLP